MNKKVSDLANLNAERITGDATFEQAALVMKKINVGMLPVVHHVKNMVEGVITDRDILVRGIAQNKKDVRVSII
jgi:predicted transcriptional regulator